MVTGSKRMEKEKFMDYVFGEVQKRVDKGKLVYPRGRIYAPVYTHNRFKQDRAEMGGFGEKVYRSGPEKLVYLKRPDDRGIVENIVQVRWSVDQYFKLPEEVAEEKTKIRKSQYQDIGTVGTFWLRIFPNWTLGMSTDEKFQKIKNSSAKALIRMNVEEAVNLLLNSVSKKGADYYLCLNPA